MKACLAAAALAFAGLTADAGAQAPIVRYAVQGDAIAASLTGRPGDAGHGAELMRDRARSLCSLCHPGPFTDARLSGDIAPSLADVGARLTPEQIRLRVVDMRALNPDTPMPSFHGIPDAPRVAALWRERPVLSADEVEDIVAYLSSLGG